MDSSFLKILICPQCRGKLHFEAARELLSCRACRTVDAARRTEAE